MDTVLQEKLVEIINLGQVGILQAVDLLKEQAPEVVRQFMAFETFSAGSGIFFGLVLLLMSLLSFLHLKKMKWNIDDGREFTSMLVLTFTGIGGIIATLMNGYLLAKIIIAPNLYIIQNLLQVLR